MLKIINGMPISTSGVISTGYGGHICLLVMGEDADCPSYTLFNFQNQATVLSNEVNISDL